jgi:hypothetical protein
VVATAARSYHRLRAGDPAGIAKNHDPFNSDGGYPILKNARMVPVPDFCRIHGSLRVTPAMEAGLADHVWNLEEVIAQLD